LIDISTDGANIYKSVNFDIWSIQFRINNIEDKRPMIAGLYAGPTKSKDFNILFVKINTLVKYLHIIIWRRYNII